jgi:predicted SnoaL-like aldol condensation-catalyzing enzyme
MGRMRILVLRHVDCESPAAYLPLLEQHADVTSVRLGVDPLPRRREFAAIVAMGGPMSVEDRASPPWLREEIDFIAAADPALADGAAATEKAYADLFAAYPQYTATVAMVVAQGDLVAVHTHVQDAPGELGTSVYEIFRVQHGKIVEHWSDTQDVPATSVNGNSMF